MRYGPGLLLVLLIVLSPEPAWGRSEHLRYREIQPMQIQWRREAERLDKMRQWRHPRMQLDVF
jgi:hypothetical protein